MRVQNALQRLAAVLSATVLLLAVLSTVFLAGLFLGVAESTPVVATLTKDAQELLSEKNDIQKDDGARSDSERDPKRSQRGDPAGQRVPTQNSDDEELFEMMEGPGEAERTQLASSKAWQGEPRRDREVPESNQTYLEGSQVPSEGGGPAVRGRAGER